MSTREIARSIIDRLSEEQLQGFIALFGKAYPPEADEDGEKDDMTERRAAFERMKSVCRYMPGLDEKKELEEYRE